MAVGGVYLSSTGGALSGHLTVEDRSLKASCQNVVVLSVLMLQEEENQRLVQCILAPTLEVKAWHTVQSLGLRNATGSAEWLKDQVVHGGYMKHCQNIISKMASAEAMEAAGFVGDAIAFKNMEEGMVPLEDDAV